MTRGRPGFVPPPYPHDRLAELKDIASAVPGGLVDCSVGTPVDPMPEVAVRALVDAASGATGYPATIGSVPVPRGRRRVDRAPVRLHGDAPTRWSRASARRSWWRRCPRALVAARPVARRRAVSRGVVPHLRDGRDARRACARCRCPLDEQWRIDLSRVSGRRRRPRARALAQRPVESHRRHRHARRDGRVGGVGARARDHRGERRVLRRVHLRRRRRADRAGHRPHRRPRRRARGALALEAVEHGRPARRLRRRRRASSSPTSARSASTVA